MTTIDDKRKEIAEGLVRISKEYGFPTIPAKRKKKKKEEKRVDT